MAFPPTTLQPEVVMDDFAAKDLLPEIKQECVDIEEDVDEDEDSQMNYPPRLIQDEVITDDVPTQETLMPVPIKLVEVSTGKEIARRVPYISVNQNLGESITDEGFPNQVPYITVKEDLEECITDDNYSNQNNDSKKTEFAESLEERRPNANDVNDVPFPVSERERSRRKDFRPPPKRPQKKPRTSIEDVIDMLDSIIDDVKEDEFDIFGAHVASQLRQLPLRHALLCQNKIHHILMKERINCSSSSTQPKLVLGSTSLGPSSSLDASESNVRKQQKGGLYF